MDATDDRYPQDPPVAPEAASSASTERQRAQTAARLERAVMGRDGAVVRHLVHAESAVLNQQSQARCYLLYQLFAHKFPCHLLTASKEMGTGMALE